MFISESVIFVELHKTGGTHIGRWLQQLVGGEQVGKHNRVPPELRHRFILGSVRNPWDWYVSLWAFGCGGQGSVRQQTTRRIDLQYCRRQLPREMGKKRLAVDEWAAQLAADWRKPVDAWRSSYRAADDRAAFREWLALMLSHERRFDMGEGYGYSPISMSSGLLTYRYLKLFTALDDELYTDRGLASLSGQFSACEAKSLVSHIIRNENLEDDLLLGLDKAGIVLTEKQCAALRNGSQNRTNSSRRRGIAYYYDQACIDLVAQREALIIDRHGYTPPVGGS